MGNLFQEQFFHQKSDDHLNSRQQVYLMCPPDHYGISYEINPWMDRINQPDLDLAREQWYNLVSNIQETGAVVEIVPPVPSLPDKVFMADTGLIDQNRFIMSRFRYPLRQPETGYAADWFRSRNYEVLEFPLGAEESLESSDVAPFRGCLVAGYGFRTTLSTHEALVRLVQKQVLSIKFVDPRFYHLDISFCPLDDRRAIVAPAAWSRHSCELVEKLVPEPLVLELDEAMTFCANAIVVGKTVIMPSCPLRVGRILERWGYMICVSPVSEFIKAGGAVHCLALDLQRCLSRSEVEIQSQRETGASMETVLQIQAQETFHIVEE
jgi:N-dimethylarginine dimethylaminohydrolase